jgi:hypothetical protein
MRQFPGRGAPDSRRVINAGSHNPFSVGAEFGPAPQNVGVSKQGASHSPWQCSKDALPNPLVVSNELSIRAEPCPADSIFRMFTDSLWINAASVRFPVAKSHTCAPPRLAMATHVPSGLKLASASSL